MLLYATPCLTASALPPGDLVLEWHGWLKLGAVQQASAGLLRLVTWSGCRDLLLSVEEVTGTDQGVAAWLGAELLPALCRPGRARVALVHGLSLPALLLAQQLASHIAPAHAAGLFSDREHAASWLYSTHRPGGLLPGLVRNRPRTCLPPDSDHPPTVTLLAASASCAASLLFSSVAAVA